MGYAYRVIPREKPHLIVTSLSRQESTPLMLSRMSKEICSLGEKLLEKFIETEDISMFLSTQGILRVGYLVTGNYLIY